MNLNQLSVALYTLVHKEIRRFMRIWPQTFLPPAITMSLYFVTLIPTDSAAIRLSRIDMIARPERE